MFDDFPDNADSELANTALLYASGELDEAEAEAFERRLAEDQAARDALCQAVEMNLTLSGQAQAPDPAYRQGVRQRLQQRRRHLRKMTGGPTFFGQPAMWAALGAAAAVLLMVVLHHITSLHPSVVTPTHPEQPKTVERDELKQRLKKAGDEVEQLVRQLAEPGGDEGERKQREDRLRELVREMVDIDLVLMQLDIQQREKELATARETLARLGSERDRQVQKRYEELLDRVKKLRTPL